MIYLSLERVIELHDALIAEFGGLKGNKSLQEISTYLKKLCTQPRPALQKPTEIKKA